MGEKHVIIVLFLLIRVMFVWIVFDFVNKVYEINVMAGQHQKISEYTGNLYGTPHYQGIEYDWEVPDNEVIGSPGGVSSIHHHYTKGFYGKGNTSSDVYAGQGQRYNSGLYGNLYQSGQEASQAMGYYPAAPDYQYWQNQEPQQYSHSHQPGEAPLPGSPIMGFPQKEDFDFDPSFELIDSDEYPMKDGSEVSIQTKISPWVVLLIIFVIFIVFYLWAKAGDRFMVKYLHDGKRPSWKRLVVYSLIATVILGLILYLSGFPMATFEST